MRTSHLRLLRLIKDKRQKLTDQELFSSAQFAAYLMDIADNASKRYQRPVKVQLLWEPESEEIAYTDNRRIVINAANRYTAAFADKAQKADSLVGFFAHELGHVNYTCFLAANTYFYGLQAGKLRPALTGLSKAEKEAKEALKTYCQDKNEAAMAVIKQTAHKIWNIIEDAYIEAHISCDFPGRFAYAIALNRQEMWRQGPSLAQQLDQGLPKLAIMQNMLLQYCLYGAAKNPEGLTGELWDHLIRCAPDIDEAKYDDDAKARSKAASRIMLKLWPYVEEAIADFTLQLDAKRSKASGG